MSTNININANNNRRKPEKNVLDALQYADNVDILGYGDLETFQSCVLKNHLKYDRKVRNAIYSIIENCIKYHVYDDYVACEEIKKVIKFDENVDYYYNY